MSDALKAHFTRLFDYERKCSPLVMSSLRASRAKIEEVGLAALEAPHERAVEIFCHMQAARRLWLSRIRPDLTAFPSDGVFPVWPVEQVEKEAQEVDELWERYVSELSGTDLARPVRYSSTEGVAYISTLSDILTHVINHSSYHRGQIASLVAKTGVRPAVTDFIALTREKA